MKTKKLFKTKFKAASYINCFTVIPTIRITYSGDGKDTGFGVELSWGKWAIGYRFYK